jgi:hypothetical protein
MLHEVLPRLVVASKPAAEPVFVRIVFTLGTTYTDAWQLIRDRLLSVCQAFDVGAQLPPDTDMSKTLPDFVLAVAQGFKEQGRQLWLLIDECQVWFLSWLRLC